MFLIYENGIRGGISQAIHKYAKSNNKYMKSYNKNVISSYLPYQDANNLYGWAMSKKLPVANFKWGNTNLYTEEIINNYNENSKYGAILEVDIEYPKKLHKLYLDLPFLTERKVINKTSQLITSFENKDKHCCIKTSLKSWIKILKSA